MYSVFLLDRPVNDGLISEFKACAPVERLAPDALLFSDPTMQSEEQIKAHFGEGSYLVHDRDYLAELPKLIAFDMDSTLIRAECIDEMARAYSVYDEVSEITRQAMRGELDFNQSLEGRLALLKGMPEQDVYSVWQAIDYQWGAHTLFEFLKTHGVKTAILSGGFTWFAERVAAELGVDFIVANTLEIQDKVLTGNVVGEIVNAQVKAHSLQAIAQKLGVDIRDTVAVGDGANDLQMMSVAGLGVAIHGKPAVVEKADAAINRGGIDRLINLLGYSLSNS